MNILKRTYPIRVLQFSSIIPSIRKSLFLCISKKHQLNHQSFLSTLMRPGKTILFCLKVSMRDPWLASRLNSQKILNSTLLSFFFEQSGYQIHVPFCLQLLPTAAKVAHSIGKEHEQAIEEVPSAAENSGKRAQGEGIFCRSQYLIPGYCCKCFILVS